MEAGLPDRLAETGRLPARLAGHLMERAGMAGMPFGLACARARPGGFGPEDGERLNGSLLNGDALLPGSLRDLLPQAP